MWAALVPYGGTGVACRLQGLPAAGVLALPPAVTASRHNAFTGLSGV